MQDIKINFRKVLYLFIVLVAYYLGDSQIGENAWKKIYPDKGFTIFSKNTTDTNGNANVTQTIFSNKINYIGEYTVYRVVDGDTVDVLDSNNNKDVVRFLAVNTLEKNSLDDKEKCFALKQTKLTENMLLNKKVFLYGDKTQTERDKYGRLLAYVATSSNPGDYFYNQYLVETGNADSYRASPEAVMYKKYQSLVQESKKLKLNMWSTTCN
jgi:endonuclease YncB( thermonuclease family)